MPLASQSQASAASAMSPSQRAPKMSSRPVISCNGLFSEGSFEGIVQMPGGIKDTYIL
jgi:hypothetical protein